MRLLQFAVFGFGGDEEWNFGIGVFPEREEVLIGDAGFGCVAFEGVGAR
jgi:hypothetical protein